MVYSTLPTWLTIPKRFNIAVMLFMACLMSYMMRVNLSINIIAMVESTDSNSTEVLPDYGPRYNWSQSDQAMLLGAYFYGYMITSLPAGMLAENFGGKAVAGYSCFLAGILTAITPQAAAWDLWAVWAIRFAIGFLTGVVYPCCHNLVSKWAPPDEKGKFVASLMGGTFGTVITWPISGLIVQHMGWDWAFYMVGIFVAIVCIVWFIIVDDSPSQHTTISVKEKEYIEKSLGDTVSNKKRYPPYKALALSPPFWSLLFLHYGSMWGLFFLITATPKFLSEVLGFNLASAGFLSSLPHLARLICAFGFGAVADLIRRKNWLSVTKMRKVFCLPSHVIPGIFLVILAFFGKDPYVCVAIMTVSLAFNGAATASNLQNSQDLAPNYAGTLYGIINCVGTTPGIFSPMIVAAFTKENRYPPYKAMLSSIPFWALTVLQYGNAWGLFFLITATPKFLSEVLGFNLASAGFLSSLPHLARLICAFGFGAVGDLVRRKDWLSVTKMRKVFCLPSHVIPGIFLIILAYFGKSPYAAIAIMTISLAFNGAATASSLQNFQDLAPNYAGTLYGLINCVTTTSGIFSTMLVAVFTKENNTIDEWHYVFIIGAAIYILSAVIFWIFGSGKIQKWNDNNATFPKEEIVITKL